MLPLARGLPRVGFGSPAGSPHRRNCAIAALHVIEPAMADSAAIGHCAQRVVLPAMTVNQYTLGVNFGRRRRLVAPGTGVSRDAHSASCASHLAASAPIPRERRFA